MFDTYMIDFLFFSSFLFFVENFRGRGHKQNMIQISLLILFQALVWVSHISLIQILGEWEFLPIHDCWIQMHSLGALLHTCMQWRIVPLTAFPLSNSCKTKKGMLQAIKTENQTNLIDLTRVLWNFKIDWNAVNHTCGQPEQHLHPHYVPPWPWNH